jgi:NAD(P)-dependent dehydrogenase (short-subunit alcohol dehydrogenase family)
VRTRRGGFGVVRQRRDSNVGYADELFDLSGKVVVITGGSRGLGRQMAGACARLGADLVIASRKLDVCVDAALEIEAETGRQAMPYALHVGRWAELQPFVEAVYDRFGQIDVLINNAGMSPLYDALADVSEQLFDSVVNLNFKGPFRLCALVGERMVAAGRGSIINVSSSGSIRPTAGIVPYAAAKAALNAMTEGFAQAYGPSVRVNTLMSGTMFTDVSKSWDMTAFNESITSIALARGGDPSEIIGAAVYLASDASSYTTGATIRVDGGIP